MSRVVPRMISLTIDGTDVSDEISSAKVTSAKSSSSFTSFLAARSGGARDYALALTLAQDHAADSLYTKVLEHAGDKVPGVYAPYGNEVPTADQPHYNIEATIAEPDGDLMGADADEDTAGVATIAVSWALTSKPSKITA